MIRLPAFEYLAPRTVGDAVKYLADRGADAMLVAGGTDLFPNMKRGQFEPKALVGLRGIRELSGVSGDGRAGLTIGAATTLSAVVAHPEVARRYPALATAAGLVSSPQLRNASCAADHGTESTMTSPKLAASGNDSCSPSGLRLPYLTRCPLLAQPCPSVLPTLPAPMIPTVTGRNGVAPPELRPRPPAHRTTSHLQPLPARFLSIEEPPAVL